MVKLTTADISDSTGAQANLDAVTCRCDFPPRAVHRPGPRRRASPFNPRQPLRNCEINAPSASTSSTSRGVNAMQGRVTASTFRLPEAPSPLSADHFRFAPTMAGPG